MIPATFLYPWLVDADAPHGDSGADASRKALRTPWIAHARSMQYTCALVAAAVVFGG